MDLCIAIYPPTYNKKPEEVLRVIFVCIWFYDPWLYLCIAIYPSPSNQKKQSGFPTAHFHLLFPFKGGGRLLAPAVALYIRENKEEASHVVVLEPHLSRPLCCRLWFLWFHASEQWHDLLLFSQEYLPSWVYLLHGDRGKKNVFVSIFFLFYIEHN